jgi:predicted RecB family nuclease
LTGLAEKRRILTQLVMITASQLYDFVRCPHRISLDAFGNLSLRDEPNPFVQLLWEQGIDHEASIVASLSIGLDIRHLSAMDRERETLAAIKKRVPLIYGGRLISEDLVGEPDLLEFRGSGYIPGDIKSGSGFEGDEGEGKLKKHYAFQLAHYVLILEQLGLSDGSRKAFVIDRHGDRVAYVLTEPQGPRNTETWWDSYQQALAHVRAIFSRAQPTLGALCSECKLCHWHSHCKREFVAQGDLTLIAELGRSKRDVMVQTIPTIDVFAVTDPTDYIRDKKTIFPGIGPDTLSKFHERAKLLTTPGARPYLKSAANLRIASKEVYYDIESDPMRDVVYLHGFVERGHAQPSTSRYIPFFAQGIDSAHEESVFREGWAYLNLRLQDSIIYYYSKFERTMCTKLAEKYPSVCSVTEVEGLFASPAMVDLRDVVVKATEWPTYDRSIKTLAQYLDFQWRDTHPSGAASIEWYHRWIESGDPAIKQRILDYNEDDCLATGVVVDCIRSL